MHSILLPISKSIANRWLILQALHGDGLMAVSDAMPDDVVLMHQALTNLNHTTSHCTLDLANCGTAMRFLTAYCAQLEGKTTILSGVERMHQRPIGQLVDALRSIGAHIDYLGEEGFPPLQIQGKALNKQTSIRIDNPLSTQYVSALLLIGAKVETNSSSPYIDITRSVIKYHSHPQHIDIENDWSSAAFWYEYVALHGGTLCLPGLFKQSIQGDKIVADIFAQLGVSTLYTATGICISHATTQSAISDTIAVDFSYCPDLYPAVAITCERLSVTLQATGTESLTIKECDRLQAVSQHQVCADHRMAMALLVAGYPVEDTDCIHKSYPQFMREYQRIHTLAGHNSAYTAIVPRRGINDEGLGKKHALHRLISAATTDYVWLQDDDIIAPTADIPSDLLKDDLYILPLRMQSAHSCPSILERLQIAEYAAIQQLTIQSAQQHRAIMCSGANLIVRRDKWLESYPELHPEIPSGDDMFLLESFKRRKLSISVLDLPQYEAIVSPHTSWKAFFLQRMRWAGKAPKYTDRDILRYGAIILILNLLQIICPPIIFVKFPWEYRLIKKRDQSVSFGTALLLELLYPFYMLICLIGGLFRRQW